MANVLFLPDGATHAAGDGESVLDVARRVGLRVATDCGGEGTCGKCVVRVLGNAPAHETSDERHLTVPQLEDGWRLSCRLVPGGAETLTVQLVHQIQSVKHAATTLEAALPLKPRVRRVALQLAEPSLQDQ